MKYRDGRPVKLGDRVELGGEPGVVVCSIDDGVGSQEHPIEQWGYLGQGAVIEFAAYGLIHYVEAEPDLVFVASA